MLYIPNSTEFFPITIVLLLDLETKDGKGFK